MEKFVKGQRVKATITGEIYRVEGDGIYIQNNHTRLYLNPDYDTWDVEVLEPVNWPPEPGDVWEANGYDYVVFKHGSLNSVQVERSDGVDVFNSSWKSKTFNSFKALNPILVYRKGVK